MTQWKAAVIVVAVSSSLTLAFVAVLGWALRDLPDEIKLPLLIVAAVAGLLASLALVVAVFSIYDLANKAYALGLPDGSVRAIIALLLIVLFSATTVFLTVRLRGAAAGAPVVDFAKQLLTILGTLMTSVTSFYFGTRAVSDGAKVSQSGPTATEPPAAPQETVPKTSGGPSAPELQPQETQRASNGDSDAKVSQSGPTATELPAAPQETVPKASGSPPIGSPVSSTEDASSPPEEDYTMVLNHDLVVKFPLKIGIRMPDVRG